MRIRPFVVRCAPPLAWAAATALLLLGLGALWPDPVRVTYRQPYPPSAVSLGQAVGILTGLLVALRGRGLRDWVLGPVLGFAVGSLDRGATRWLRLAGLEGEACWVFPVAGLLAGWLIAWRRRSLWGACVTLLAVAAADALGRWEMGLYLWQCVRQTGRSHAGGPTEVLWCGGALGLAPCAILLVLLARPREAGSAEAPSRGRRVAWSVLGVALSSLLVAGAAAEWPLQARVEPLSRAKISTLPGKPALEPHDARSCAVFERAMARAGFHLAPHAEWYGFDEQRRVGYVYRRLPWEAIGVSGCLHGNYGELDFNGNEPDFSPFRPALTIGWLDLEKRGQFRAIGILREPWERDQTAILVLERVSTPSEAWGQDWYSDGMLGKPSDVTVPADPWKRAEEVSILSVLAEGKSAAEVEEIADEFLRAIRLRDTGAPIQQGVLEEGPLLPAFAADSERVRCAMDGFSHPRDSTGRVIAKLLVPGDPPRIRLLLIEDRVSLGAEWAWSGYAKRVSPDDAPKRCGVAWVNGDGMLIQEPGPPGSDACRLSEWMIPCKWRWIGRDPDSSPLRRFLDLGHEAEALGR